MSMMSEKLMPSACEVDVAGTVAMYALQLASGKPSALVDWNNNYGDDPEQVRLLPLRQLGQGVPAGHRDRHRADSGHRLSARRTPTARSPAARRAGPVTFARVSTDDRERPHRAPTSARAASPTIRWRRSAPARSSRCRSCRS